MKQGYKEVIWAAVCVVLMIVLINILMAWVAYEADAVTATASVQPNPCSICVELCR
jgi:hypothetical protein